MLVVTPVAFDESEESFWTGAEARTLLKRLFGELAGLGDWADVRVFTDVDWAARMASRAGLAHSPLGSSHAASRDGLPRGARRAVGGLLETGADLDDGLMLLDFRDASLTGATLEAARASFRAAGRDLLLGVRRPVDHPCQFVEFIESFEAGLLCLFDMALTPDGEGGLGGRFVSRTLPGTVLSAEERERFGMSGVGVSGFSDSQARWGVVSEESRGLRLAGRIDPAWERRAGEGRAPTGRRLSGVSLDMTGGLGLLTAWSAEPGQLSVRLEPREEPVRADLVLLPFDADGPLPDLATRLPSMGGWRALPPELVSARVHGFVYSLTRKVAKGGHDFELPCLPGAAPWRLAPYATGMADRVTGRLIAGRQDFPEIYEDSFGLRIAGPAGIEDLLLPQPRTSAALFEMAGGPDARVQDEIGLLRCLAQTEKG